jgi:hypothetical protein
LLEEEVVVLVTEVEEELGDIERMFLVKHLEETLLRKLLFKLS